MKKNSLIFLSLVITFSCTSNNDLAESEIVKIEKEVLSSFEQFEESLTNGELETISNYYSDDPRFYWVENGTIAYPTGASARNAIKEFYPSLKSMIFKSLNKKVTPITSSLAMIYVEYEQVLVFPSNQQLKIDGAMTILMEKKNSEWEYIIGHSSGKNEDQG